MAAMKRSPVVEIFWKIHPFLYRVSGGRLLGRLVGLDVLLLTTTGRKSGEPRMLPLLYVQVDAGYVIVASKGGAPQHPAWYLNLLKTPDSEIQVGTEHHHVKARVVEGEERATLWKKMTELYAPYDDYQVATDREIPVVVLEPTN